MNLKTKLWILFFVILMVSLVKCSSSVYDQSVSLYNTSVGLNGDYSVKTQEQVAVYDANYLAFKAKSGIADINKETFITVTDIIMSARKDGQNVAWKWVQENQQIPFNEFTDFYKELSSFIGEQYAGLLAIEKEKQRIVNTHNVLITTYPNNIFNWYLKIPKMKYEYGYISDSTRLLFKLK